MALELKNSERPMCVVTVDRTQRLPMKIIKVGSKQVARARDNRQTFEWLREKIDHACPTTVTLQCNDCKHRLFCLVDKDIERIFEPK